MPVYLESQDMSSELKDFGSVLIVACAICPPMCLAMQKKKPFMEFFKHGLNTESFSEYIESIREPLKQRGVRTDVYMTRVPSPMMCVWTKGQQDRLLKRAKGFEAVLVLGCDSATYTAKAVLKDTNCQVFQGMRMIATANATVRFGFPGTVELDLNAVPKKHIDRQQKAAEEPKEAAS